VINGQGNVASITDNAVGDYTINFTTAMSDAKYAVALATSSVTGNNTLYIRLGGSEVVPVLKTASALRVGSRTLIGSELIDVADASVVIYQ
jgi:hypothetical protein